MVYQELLHNLLTVFFTAFGSLLGSFSNVVILRMSNGKSVIFPPSACPNCDHQLHAIDLVPVFSWLFLRGKCRYCKAEISWQYPVVESIIAILVGLSFYKCSLKFDFIALAGTSVIWFIATVIFIRREVLAPGPYLWPAIIFVLFSFPVTGCPFFSMPVKLAPFFALAIGLLASFRAKFETLYAWSGLSFLFIFSLAPAYGYYTILPLAANAVIAFVLPGKRLAERLLSAQMIVAIFMKIAMK